MARKLRHQGIARVNAVVAVYEQLRRHEVNVVHLGHPAYPPLVLARLGEEAPPLLFCREPLERLKVRGVVVVGARHAGERALAVAEQHLDPYPSLWPPLSRTRERGRG